MSNSPTDKLLNRLISIAEEISRGYYRNDNDLFEFTINNRYPPLITRLAESFGMMTVQVEAREFHLEQTIEDLIKTKEALRLTIQQLQKSLQELEQAQMRIIQQEKMESVGRLAAGVAHEVKNPLAVIQLGADFLSSQLKDNLPLYETVQEMAEAVQRADTVIKGMLDFSRSEQLELKPVSIATVVDEALLLVRHELKSRQINVSTCHAPNLPQLLLDQNKIKQVFINLFINAAHAMDSGGNLDIAIARHVVTAKDLTTFGNCNGQIAKGDEAIEVIVADTGTGISQASVTKVFDPFFTTKPIGVGTGLGLSVTRKILELHHAVIALQNRTDQQGAKATLLFTIKTQTSEDKP